MEAVPWVILIVLAAVLLGVATSAAYLALHELLALWASPFPPDTGEHDALPRLRQASEALWEKVARQLPEDRKFRTQAQYWGGAVTALRRSDDQLFDLLDRRLNRKERHQFEQFIGGSGILHLAESAASGTPTTLALRALEKANGGVSQGIENLGMTKKRLLRWAKALVEVKKDLISNLLAGSQEAENDETFA